MCVCVCVCVCVCCDTVVILWSGSKSIVFSGGYIRQVSLVATNNLILLIMKQSRGIYAWLIMRCTLLPTKFYLLSFAFMACILGGNVAPWGLARYITQNKRNVLVDMQEFRRAFRMEVISVTVGVGGDRHGHATEVTCASGSVVHFMYELLPFPTQ